MNAQKRGWSDARHHLRRFAGFSIGPAIATITTILILPIVSRRFGSDGWSAIGLGQGVGALGGVAVALAWPIVGAQRVATERSVERRTVIFVESLYSRMLVFVVVAPLAFWIAFAISPGQHFASGLLAIAFAGNGLTCSWFYAGTEKPAILIRNEAIPRLFGYIFAAVLIASTGLLWVFPTVMVVVFISMVLLNIQSVTSFRGGWTRMVGPRHAVEITRAQLGGGVSRLIGALSLYGGTTLVGVANPTLIPAYSAVDQLQRALSNAANIVPQSLAGWVGRRSAGPHFPWRVLRFCLVVSVMSGVLTFAGWIFLSPFVTNFIFGGQIDLSSPERVASGALFGSIVTAQSLSLLCMVPLGLTRIVYRSSAFYSVVSVLCLFAGIKWYDLTFGLAGLACGFLFMSVHYIIVAYLSRRAVVHEEVLESESGTSLTYG